MTYDQILQGLKARNFAPVYFLHGSESYALDQLTDYIERNVLTESEKAFNQTIVYGKDTEARQLQDVLTRYPMMAPKQLVIVKEAQEMKTLAALQSYIEKPVPTTILVIVYKHKKFDGRTKFGKAIKKNATVFHAQALYDNQIPAWIVSYLKKKKLEISSKGAELLAEYLGTNLSKVANELDKLAINLPKGSKVTVQHIQDNIGISKDFNVFEFQKALGMKDLDRAYRILNYFIANPKKNPSVMVIASLFNYFKKIYLLHFTRHLSDQEKLRVISLGSSYFLKEYKAAARNFPLSKTQAVIQLLHDYDLRSKGVENVSTDSGELLREMTYRILHV